MTTCTHPANSHMAMPPDWPTLPRVRCVEITGREPGSGRALTDCPCDTEHWCAAPGCYELPETGPYTGSTDLCPRHWGIADRSTAETVPCTGCGAPMPGEHLPTCPPHWTWRR